MQPSYSVNLRLLDAVNANTNVTSAVVDLGPITALTVQKLWSSIGGTVTVNVQASNVVPASSTANHWTTINTTTVTGTNNAAFQLNVVAYSYLRITLTQTGGSGLVSVILNAK